MPKEEVRRAPSHRRTQEEKVIQSKRKSLMLIEILKIKIADLPNAPQIMKLVTRLAGLIS